MQFAGGSASSAGSLAFSEFNRLVAKAHELAQERAPAYPVVRDMFEAVDIRQDGEIDLHEWQQTFGRVTEGPNKLSIKATPLSMWENSREFASIGFLVAKNRKQLAETFKTGLAGSNSPLFTLEQGRALLDDWLHSKGLGALTDQQLSCVLRVAQVPSASQMGAMFDWQRLLEAYRQRHCPTQSK